MLNENIYFLTVCTEAVKEKSDSGDTNIENNDETIDNRVSDETIDNQVNKEGVDNDLSDENSDNQENQENGEDYHLPNTTSLGEYEYLLVRCISVTHTCGRKLQCLSSGKGVK